MKLSKSMQKELQKLIQLEQRWLAKEEKSSELKEKLYEKVPQGLSSTLEKAFGQAFSFIFLKGTKILEKTYDKSVLEMEHKVADAFVEETPNRKSMKLLDRKQRRDNLINHVATTATGAGLGVLGMGVPDIPLLVSTILRGIYEVAIAYGFAYETMEERVYILQLIRLSLLAGEEKRQEFKVFRQLENERLRINEEVLNCEIAKTSKALSDALLVEKFIQGIPVVGVVGGIVNHNVYKKILYFVKMEYKRRYILVKGRE